MPNVKMKSKLPTRFQVCHASMVDKDLMLKLEPTISINDKVKSFRCILRDFWSQLAVKSGEFINIFDPLVEETLTDDPQVDPRTMIVTNNNGLAVINPDTLVSITSLMSSSYCMRQAWLSRSFEIFGEANKALLIGNIVHQLFQEGFRKNETTFAEIEKMFLNDILKRVTLDLYKLNLTTEELIADIRPYITSVSNWFKYHFDKSLPKPFEIRGLHEIENNIWSIKYGMVGKVDLTLELTLQEQMKKFHHLFPFELKTGKHTFSPQHQGQVILYSFIMSDKYANYKPSGGYLVYLKDDHKTEMIKTNHHVFRDLIILRNNFVQYYENHDCVNEEKAAEFVMNGPEPIENERMCTRCEHYLDCSLMHKTFDRENPGYFSEFSTTNTSHLTATDLDFFSRMISLLEIEKRHCLASDEFVSFWNHRSEECEAQGIGLCKMQIKYQDSYTIILQRSTKVFQTLDSKFFSMNPDLILNPNLLVDRRVVISEEMVNSLQTYEIYGNFCKLLCVTVGQICSISQDMTEITINLEKEQIIKLNPNAVFRIDFLKTQSTRATLINFSNMLRLMTPNDPKAAELRQIIIHGRIPKFNINDCKISSFSRVLNSPILARLNFQQKRSVLGILRTKCSLIFGSPGSGKTQTIVSLIQILSEFGFSVLVTSYTHVAVDNILLKLIQANEELNKTVDFIRMGSARRIHRNLVEYTDHHRTKTWIEKGDLNALTNFYATIPVVSSTCLGVFSHPIFSKRTFDFCIIDEASQVFLSTSLGPLFNCHNFVLVGDQKQLPPVVQSPMAKKKGLGESLFSRLLHMSGKQNVSLYDDTSDTADLDDFGSCNKKSIDLKSVRIFPLFIQYRMNSVIMQVANELTYSGKLKCGTKQIESISMRDYLATTPQVSELLQEYEQSYLSKVVSPCLTDSVVFIDTDKIDQAVEVHVSEGMTQKSVDSPYQLNSKPQTGYVYNEFETQLIVHLVRTLLRIYKGGEFKVDNIGIISPFRRQVVHLKEKITAELSPEQATNLEINTVDSYQGRDKDVIIYSCVKSAFNLETEPTTSEPGVSQLSKFSQLPAIDSELLKDERRLNVAITRAKRKLIIVGNRKTLARYGPFHDLFDVLRPEQFVELADYDFQDAFL